MMRLTEANIEKIKAAIVMLLELDLTIDTHDNIGVFPCDGEYIVDYIRLSAGSAKSSFKETFTTAEDAAEYFIQKQFSFKRESPQ